MPVDVLLGLQWGDEGKGKVVDYLAPKYDVVARFQGGPNAGHTLEFDGIKHVLHQIPSGIFRQDIINVIGNGVVLDPVTLKREIEALAKFGIDPKHNLFISRKAQLILPSHRMLDKVYEKDKGDQKIGSTLKGIGPTYQDKIGRMGLRMGDIMLKDFDKRYKSLKAYHKQIIDFYDGDLDVDSEDDAFLEALDFLKQYNLVDSEYLINEYLRDNKKILAEGAQGSLLDVDFGSYPFVTSSTTTCAGACTGLGVSPRNIGEVMGIFKAYCTRVGSGPFPTELFDQDGEKMRKEGNEFGATTGRPRRCGWLDLPALNYATMINGVTRLFMMKADVLNTFTTIKVATNYTIEGETTDHFPFDTCDENIKPNYEEIPGWSSPTNNIKDSSDLPKELTAYIQYIEAKTSTPVGLLSLGPDRSQTIEL